MNVVGSRSARSLGLLKNRYHTSPNTTRTYTAASAALLQTPSTTINSDPSADAPHPLSYPHPRPRPYTIASSVVLSRPPVLTRDIPDFENAFYFYQRRLDERLALPFVTSFYFKRGTLAEQEWRRKQRAIPDKYNAYRDGWKDELQVGDYRWKQPDLGYQKLLESTVTGEDVSDAEKGEGQIEGDMAGEVKKSLDRPLSRETDADRRGDTRSLDRKLSRTVYLVVKRKRDTHAWKFPQSDLVGEENLKEAAMRVLDQAAGPDMNTWFVGNAPIGYYKYDFTPDYPGRTDTTLGKKVWFMKARIMAGQADLGKGTMTNELEDFQWLCKEELEKTVDPSYWAQIKTMLVDQ